MKKNTPASGTRHAVTNIDETIKLEAKPERLKPLAIADRHQNMKLVIGTAIEHIRHSHISTLLGK